MNHRITSVAKGTLIIIASLVALLVGSVLGIGSVQITFANKGINLQTDTNQDQRCEPAGGTSGITNACTASSTPGSTQTSVTLRFSSRNNKREMEANTREWTRTRCTRRAK
jgi:hypothetical protein